MSGVNSQTAEPILTKLGTHILLFTGNILGKKKQSLQVREGKRQGGKGREGQGGKGQGGKGRAGQGRAGQGRAGQV